MIRKNEDYKALECPIIMGTNCRAERCALWEDFGNVDKDGKPYCGVGESFRAGWCGLAPKRVKL